MQTSTRGSKALLLSSAEPVLTLELVLDLFKNKLLSRGLSTSDENLSSTAGSQIQDVHELGEGWEDCLT